jgi:hypothetical protein
MEGKGREGKGREWNGKERKGKERIAQAWSGRRSGRLGHAGAGTSKRRCKLPQAVPSKKVQAFRRRHAGADGCLLAGTDKCRQALAGGGRCAGIRDRRQACAAGNRQSHRYAGSQAREGPGMRRRRHGNSAIGRQARAAAGTGRRWPSISQSDPGSFRQAQARSRRQAGTVRSKQLCKHAGAPSAGRPRQVQALTLK